MSLKGVHVLFISLSVALAIVTALWSFGQYSAGQGIGYVLGAIGSVAGASGLVVYARSFVQKARRIGLE